ncbi:MAG TPA: efflux RND transporter permease subunit, partial [Steroidobacteraceae bacterium]
SLLVAMSATPALCALTMARHEPRGEARFLQSLKKLQLRAIVLLERRPRILYAILIASGTAGVACLPLLGARFLPDFRENYLIVHASSRPGGSLGETGRIGRHISAGLLQIPGVKSVAEQIGRAENGQDPDGPHKSEFEVQFDPLGHSPAEVERAIRKVFADYPNIAVEVNSVLAERIGETLSGVSALFSVSVIGSDLDTDDRVGAQIVDVLQHLAGSGNVRLLVPPRQAELQITLLPRELTLYGLQAADVLGSVSAAYHGRVAAQINQPDRSVPLVVRLHGASADPNALGVLLLRGRGGALIPLSSVAKVDMVLGRSVVEHQDGLRRQIVVASPSTSDQSGYARSARRAIASKVSLPPGVYLRYGGVAEAEHVAASELLMHCLAAFVLIVLLLALAFGNSRHVLLVLLSLPSTLIGGVVGVALTGGTLTLGSMVGFVALFGMAARNTILLVSHYDHLVREEGQPWSFQTALRGAEERLTPVLLTALLTAFALLPVAMQGNQAGHEIEGPMAIVILGGLISSTGVSLLLIPPLASRWLRDNTASHTIRVAPAVSLGRYSADAPGNSGKIP